MAERIPWFPADGSQGVEHQRRDGTDCPYLAMIACNKCGWCDPDPERVAAASALLSRLTVRDPLCECGQRESGHLVLPGGRRGACAFISGTTGACGCLKFSAAPEVPAGER